MKKILIILGTTIIVVCSLFIIKYNFISKINKLSNLSILSASQRNENEIEYNYNKLSSPDFEERYKAVYFFSKLKKDKFNNKIMKLTFDLFEKELNKRKEAMDLIRKLGNANKLPQEMVYLNSEQYGMYSVYLCEILGKSNDISLLPFLVEHCLIPEVLINFGDSAVKPVMNIVQTTSNPIKKMSAISVLSEMLKHKKEGYIVKGELRRKIKEVLIKATKDPDRYIKSMAVNALGDSEDKDIIPILEKIEENDPYSFKEKDITSGTIKIRYPVREEAKKTLEELKAKEIE